MPPNARALAEALVGRTIFTLAQRRPNDVLTVAGANVFVGTERSPDGEPVALRKLQEALDILYSTGEFRVTPETLGGYRRSSFIGAMLGLLEGVQVDTRPTVVRLPAVEPEQITVTVGGGAGYPDPITTQLVDEVGTEIAMDHLRNRHPGHEVYKMPHANPGFDAKVLDEDGVVIKYVEIKSTLGPSPAFFMSENERAFAEAHAEAYELVVVTSIDLESRRSGAVRVHEGSLAPDAVSLVPRQWKGVLTS